jgi:ubiquitin-protein ligase E3 D
VTYVAEHHENLQRVLVFANVSNVIPGKNVTAQVLPASTTTAHADEPVERERLVFRCGDRTCAPLSLPVRVRPSGQDLQVQVQNSHFEVKLATYGPSTAASPMHSELDRPPLLDARQLEDARPTSFLCASCSLPLVAPAKAPASCVYKDLPSEHWAELVDAWMCHSTQKLNEHVVRHGKGVWPRQGEALVGGSYILFDESCIVKTNLSAAEEPKVSVRVYESY